MSKEINIDKVLFPDSGELYTDKEGTIRARIIDEEIDPIDVRFDYDGCVHIDTKEYTHITLSLDNLSELMGMIIEAEEEYKVRFDKERQNEQK